MKKENCSSCRREFAPHWLKNGTCNACRNPGAIVEQLAGYLVAYETGAPDGSIKERVFYAMDSALALVNETPGAELYAIRAGTISGGRLLKRGRKLELMKQN
jgi:hypothetical protein